MKKRKSSSQKAAAAGGASIYDVAKQARVSIVTVSRVFNDYPHVSGRMRERVFAAAREVGYTPRLVSKPKVIAVVIGHLDHISAGDYKTRLLLYLVQEAAKLGYLVEFIPFDSAELATKHLVDAVVEVGLTDEEVLKLTHLPQVPTFLVNKTSPKEAWCTMSSDQLYEGQVATAHLVDNGHRRIALILDDPSGWGVEQRRAGYEKAGSKTGKTFKPLVFCTSETAPEEIARQLVAARCTACVNFTDNFGFAVLDSCVHDLEMDIPKDLSVVSLENKSVSQFWNPRLTTIEQPLSEIAGGVVKGIVQLLEKPGKSIRRVYKCKLIERDSVRRVK